MGFFRAVKNGLKSGFKVNRWVGMEHIKNNAKVIRELSTQLLKKSKASETENLAFDEYLKRNNLTEEGLNQFKRNAVMMGGIYLGASALAVAYAVVLAMHHHISGTFFSLMLGLLLFAYSFREYFNLYRAKQRRLDVTVKQWVQQQFSSRSK